MVSRASGTPIYILIYILSFISQIPITYIDGEWRYLLDSAAIKAIESAMQDGCTVEVKVENGNVVIVQKREKRTVTYRGLAVKS